jgi:hypothetical protein
MPAGLFLVFLPESSFKRKMYRDGLMSINPRKQLEKHAPWLRLVAHHLVSLSVHPSKQQRFEIWESPNGRVDLARQLDEDGSFQGIIGKSAVMQKNETAKYLVAFSCSLNCCFTLLW